MTVPQVLEDTHSETKVTLPSEDVPLSASQRLVLLDLTHVSRLAAPHAGWTPYRHADVGARLGISARTVSAALRALEDLGLVEYRPGHGEDPSTARIKPTQQGGL